MSIEANSKDKKTRSISIINYKGGTGKTTTVVNLAHALALKNKRVLLIDTDPQGALSYYLGIDYKYSLYDIFFDKASLNDTIVTARKNLDLISANDRLFPAEITLAKIHNREFVLKSKLKPLENQYDFILFDCSPSLSILNQNAIMASNELIIPTALEHLSLRGLTQLLRNLKVLTENFNHPIDITAIVPTFVDKRKKITKELFEQLKKTFPTTTICPIRINNDLNQAISNQKTIFEHASKSSGSIDYKTLAKEVINV